MPVLGNWEQPGSVAAEAGQVCGGFHECDALGLSATAAVRAKLHYRRGLALRGMGRQDGAVARAFTASAREYFMKEVTAVS
eukprot:COSAG02_NODE_32034_length_523_cov_0.910377_1_plen_80_part_10